MTFRGMTSDEISDFLMNDENSEDGLEDDDDSIADSDFQPMDQEDLPGSDEDDSFIESAINELLQNEADDTFLPTSAGNSNEETTIVHNLPIQSEPSVRNKKLKLNVLWKKKNLELNDHQIHFTGNESLDPEILALETPIQFFWKIFPKDFLQYICEQTNLYIVQKDPNKAFRVSNVDIQQFIGLVYIMSLVHLPRVTKHWNIGLGTPLVKETMPVQKFEKIRQFNHFNDNSKMIPYNQPNSDRLFKIRPLIEKLNETCQSIPLEQYLCVDEQICSTKVRHNLKRYNPNKPNKWGYKLYVLCGVSGFAYKFEVETGAENVVESGVPDLGAASNVVVRLSRMIPKNQNYKIYFDNYFTSLSLLEYLAKQGILSLGTIRRNRIPDSKLPTEKDWSKKERGFSMEFVGDIEGTDVCTVAWKDNKIVTLASSFVGELPKSTVKRYDKKTKKYITIERPKIVAEYNRHMGGVDLVDSIMGRYKIILRSKRWQVRLFYHFLDLAMANAWLLYRRVRKNKNISDKQLSSADFRQEIAMTLCKLGTKTSSSRRSLEAEIQAKRHKGPSQYVPPMAVRQDQVGHWPEWAEKRIRCKLPGCNGVSQTICEKCGVALRYNKQNNCFKKFHTT